MNALDIIDKYYKKGTKLYEILIDHSTDVTNKALAIANNHPELNIDKGFIEEAAMLHDIGIYLTNAPGIECYGDKPYLAHGYLGREILDKLGYPKHGLVCERHTGTGISLSEIEKKNLPLPHRDMIPISIEEQLVCFADCFFSKTRLGKEKTVDEVKKSLVKFGDESVKKFNKWCSIFL
jgi:uncharacterized protein